MMCKRNFSSGDVFPALLLPGVLLPVPEAEGREPAGEPLMVAKPLRKDDTHKPAFSRIAGVKI